MVETDEGKGIHSALVRGMGKILDYRSALKYILGLTNYEKSLKELYSPGNVDLERVRELLRRLGSPESGLGIVHIAGTKGKGSTAAMISSVLQKAGYRVGLFTSPHLHTFRERVQINREPISAEDFAGAMEKVKPHVEEINAVGEHGYITTFEALTAMALVYFAEKQVEALVFEVGVGGRLDATNVVTPEVSVITSISRDHTELLGETLPEIAGEKAGIIKKGVPVVVAPQVREVEEVIGSIAKERGSEMVNVGRESVWRALGHDDRGQSLLIRDFENEYSISMPLLGDHQQENAATAIAALSVLRQKGVAYLGHQHPRRVCGPTLAGSNGGARETAFGHSRRGAQRGLGAEAEGGAAEVLRVWEGGAGGGGVCGQEHGGHSLGASAPGLDGDIDEVSAHEGG